MSFFRNVKEFFHNVTTSDHYAQYNNNNTSHAQHSSSPRRANTPLNNGSQLSFQNNASTASLVAHSRPSTSSNNNNNNNSNSMYNNAGASKSNTAIPYRPGMRSQLHNDSQIELRNYENGQPVRDVEEIWESIDDWLDKEFPELGDDMEGGATANDLNAFENDLDISLPSSFRESYQIHDGQVSMGKTRGLIFTYPLMDLETIAAETNIWRRVYERFEKKEPSVINSAFGVQKSCPPKFVNEIYYDPLWIPFVKDNVGNNIAIDLNPSELGKWGQVILFGRDYNTKFVVADSFNEFLSNLSNEFLNNKYEIDEDEDLIYISNGRSYNYFDVLKAKSIARAKKIDPSYNVNETNINDSELLVQKKRNVGGLNIKSEENTIDDKIPKTTATTSNTENLPNETLISPAYPNAGKGKRDFTPSKENIATNDSFVIDDEEVGSEVESVIEPVETVENSTKEETVQVSAHEVVEPLNEPSKKSETIEVSAEITEPAQNVEESVKELAGQIPAEEVIEPTPVEQPSQPLVESEVAEEPEQETVEATEAEAEAEPKAEAEAEATAEADAEPKAEAEAEATAEADAEPKAEAEAEAEAELAGTVEETGEAEADQTTEADDTTEDVEEAETTDKKTSPGTNKKKNKKNKKKAKK